MNYFPLELRRSLNSMKVSLTIGQLKTISEADHYLEFCYQQPHLIYQSSNGFVDVNWLEILYENLINNTLQAIKTTAFDASESAFSALLLVSFGNDSRKLLSCVLFFLFTLYWKMFPPRIYRFSQHFCFPRIFW